jgi:hypothetical protein
VSLRYLQIKQECLIRQALCVYECSPNPSAGCGALCAAPLGANGCVEQIKSITVTAVRGRGLKQRQDISYCLAYLLEVSEFRTIAEWLASFAARLIALGAPATSI